MNNDRPMLARRQVRLAALAALQSIPGVTVYSPGDWSLPLARLPAIRMRIAADRKQSKQRGQPEFDTTVTLVIEAAVEGSSAEAAQDALEALGYAIEQVLLNSAPLIQISQQVASVDTEIEITAEGAKHVAGQKMLAYFEVFEAFDPTAAPPADAPWPPTVPAPVPLTEIGLVADLTNVFDPSGSYPTPTDPAYTPTSPPRTTGPDGRPEGGLDIVLPQS